MLRYILLIFLLLAPANTLASELTAAIQERYETLTAFNARFQQRLTHGATKEVEERTGAIAFQQPGLIRWTTETPSPEILIVGEETVWNYIVDEETVYTYDVEEVLGSKTMLRFISGQAKLDEEFLVEELGTGADGLTELLLIPREPEPSLVEATVWVDPELNLLKRLLIKDFYGNENDVELSQIVLNPELDPLTFTFMPPEGVEVEDNRTSPGEPSAPPPVSETKLSE